MHFRQLEYLVALAREQHFARAAETCFVTQSALSSALIKLESELGVRLVDRDRHYRGLTADGAELAAWAGRVLEEHDALAKRRNSRKHDECADGQRMHSSEVLGTAAATAFP